MCIISTAQQASPKVNGHKLFLLAQFARSSILAKANSILDGSGTETADCGLSVTCVVIALHVDRARVLFDAEAKALETEVKFAIVNVLFSKIKSQILIFQDDLSHFGGINKNTLSSRSCTETSTETCSSLRSFAMKVYELENSLRYGMGI